MIHHDDIDDGPLTSKCHKVWCCPCLIACNCFFHPCRKAVSGKKNRVIRDGFDLDMAYITPRIIVHGFPAHGIEHFYRNPRYEVRRFMDAHHQDKYKMFNFCCEPGRGYQPDVFHGRVERYPFKDHNTPPLETMTAFAHSAKAWLEQDETNVVNMHCKAGKGRAGLMCCVLLVRTGTAQSALEAMTLYDKERVTNNRGLTVTSQRKFVMFYEQLWRQCWGVTGNIGDVTAEQEKAFKVPDQPPLRLTGVELMNVPEGIVHSYSITVHKINNFSPLKLYDGGNQKGPIEADCNVVIEGNFKVFIKFKKSAYASPIRLVELQHNTFFMNHTSDFVDFGVDQLDIKKKMKEKLGPNIVLRLKFDKNAPDSIGSKGYEVVPTTEDQVELTILGGNNSTAKTEEVVANNDETADSNTPLVQDEATAAAAEEATEAAPDAESKEA